MVDRRLASVLAAAVLLPVGYDRPGRTEAPQTTATAAAACRADRAPGTAQPAGWCTAGRRSEPTRHH